MVYITSVKKFIKIWKDVISRDGSAKKNNSSGAQ